MSVNLSIKDVPDTLADRLRERAARNHRSLQGELMAIIQRAALEPVDATVDVVPGRTSSITFEHRGSKTTEQIAAEHRKLYPQPFRDIPRAVDMIREDRDSR